MKPLDPSEVEKTARNIMAGYLKLGKAAVVAGIVDNILSMDRNITIETLLQDFLIYYFTHRNKNGEYLCRLYDENKAKPAAWLTNIMWRYFMNKRRNCLNDIKSREPGVKLDYINEGVVKCSDGVHRQLASVISDYNATTCSGIEKGYLLDEFKSFVRDYTFKNHGVVYLDVLYGNISQRDAAHELNVSDRWFREMWRRYKEDLISALSDHGYTLDYIKSVVTK